MSFLSFFTTAKDDIEKLVPPQLTAIFGPYSKTLAANLKYDFETAVKAGFAEFKTLAAPMVASLVSAAETAVAAEAPQVLSGKVTFSAAIGNVVAILGSDAAKTLVPALKVAGQETLTTIVRSFMATAMTNPTLPSVSSSAASPSAPSKP